MDKDPLFRDLTEYNAIKFNCNKGIIYRASDNRIYGIRELSTFMDLLSFEVANSTIK